jgi:hypothetical protein
MIFFILLSNKVEWLGDIMNSRLRRLPISSTCSLTLMLHDTYEDSNESRIAFESDLNTGFFDSDGFNERLYRDNYTRLRGRNLTTNHTETIDLTVDDNMRQHTNTTEGVTQSNILGQPEQSSNDDNSTLSNELFFNTPPDNLVELVENNNTTGTRDSNNSGSRRGGNSISSRRGGNGGSRRGRGSNSNSSRRGNGSNARGGIEGSSRRLRSQNQHLTTNDDNWNVLLPENIEDQLRTTRSGRRIQ